MYLFGFIDKNNQLISYQEYVHGVEFQAVAMSIDTTINRQISHWYSHTSVELNGDGCRELLHLMRVFSL
jgi:hypothetical protein